MNEKKKKGKKKQGNQSKHNGSVLNAAVVNQSKPDESLQNYHGGVLSNADSQSVGVSESDVDQEKSKNHEAKCLNNNFQDCLEERIKLLQNEVASCIQKEASLEGKIDDLQSKNASLTLREEYFEERVKKMEEMHQSFSLGEVMELKFNDYRDSLVQENKKLIDSISTLELRIQHLEMAASFYSPSKIHGEDKSHQEAAEASTKPDILNEDPSEKVSEIHVEPVQLAMIVENLTRENTIKHSAAMKSSTSDYAPEFHKSILESNEKTDTMVKSNERFSVNGIEDSVSMEQLQQLHTLRLDDSRMSEDDISVPLDDNIQESQATTKKIESEPVVPFSDAPLIGAPFRLISFVARFVSGADLVDQDKP